jgi:glycogen operon protein
MTKIDATKLRIVPGRAYPPGPAIRNTGVRFAIVSRHATRVWLDLFENVEDRVPVFELEYDPMLHRTGDIWSVFIEGLSPDVLYLYRMDGPFEPDRGHRYVATRYLLDPCAKVIVGDVEAGTAKCKTVGEQFDWKDVRPRVPLSDLVIYETHVRGLTVHGSSGVKHKGTYLGVVEKIPYLKELGVTAIELLPIQEFGETRLGRCSIATRQELHDYWGYNPIGFFAPTGRYAVHGADESQLDEFRQMVFALHKAGIEVILDVVFNHTSEGTENGPTLCFRGIDNVIYYMLDDRGAYLNFSGCGNTVNCNHPLVRDFILDCLRYWATVMRVDGFRFDLASIMGRDTKGRIVENAGLIERIAEDPGLRDTKLIAEAWDMGGAYQVGSFGDVRWAEWNGQYRDDLRRFWRGDAGLKGVFATRLTGSADLYQRAGRTPGHSINFITAHDGFTLRDLVSYDRKHNEANGENNRDGLDENLSWNCGVEGETDDRAVNAVRLRMQKNYLATLFLSLGIPMLLGGDEFSRTQKGNNNAYCQDNAISWYDWTLLKKNAELFRFCKEVIRFRRENPALSRMTYFDGQPAAPGGHPDCAWFDASGEPMRWEDPAPVVACRIDGAVNASVTLYLMFNPALGPTLFRIPSGEWRLRINTGESVPADIRSEDQAAKVHGETTITLALKSMIVLSARC